MNIEDRARRAFWGGDCEPWEQLAEHIRRKWRLVVATVHKDIEDVGAMMVARWQPASSPPKSNYDVLALLSTGAMRTMLWNGVGWVSSADGRPFSALVTHWHELPAPPPKLTEVERLTKERNEARALLEKAVDKLGEYVDADLPGMGRSYFPAMRELFASWKAKP